MNPSETKDARALSDNEFRERLRTEPPPEWVREMLEFYREHGYYRPEDIQRLLGGQSDPSTMQHFGGLGLYAKGAL